MEREELKKLAGEEAVKYIKDGMIVGLGTGSTVEYTLRKLGEKVKNGLKIQGIPTSIHTKRIAKEVNISRILEIRCSSQFDNGLAAGRSVVTVTDIGSSPCRLEIQKLMPVLIRCAAFNKDTKSSAACIS